MSVIPFELLRHKTTVERGHKCNWNTLVGERKQSLKEVRVGIT